MTYDELSKLVVENLLEFDKNFTNNSYRFYNYFNKNEEKAIALKKQIEQFELYKKENKALSYISFIEKDDLPFNNGKVYSFNKIPKYDGVDISFRNGTPFAFYVNKIKEPELVSEFEGIDLTGIVDDKETITPDNTSIMLKITPYGSFIELDRENIKVNEKHLNLASSNAYFKVFKLSDSKSIYDGEIIDFEKDLLGIFKKDKVYVNIFNLDIKLFTLGQCRNITPTTNTNTNNTKKSKTHNDEELIR